MLLYNTTNSYRKSRLRYLTIPLCYAQKLQKQQYPPSGLPSIDFSLSLDAAKFIKRARYHHHVQPMQLAPTKTQYTCLVDYQLRVVLWMTCTLSMSVSKLQQKKWQKNKQQVNEWCYFLGGNRFCINFSVIVFVHHLCRYLYVDSVEVWFASTRSKIGSFLLVCPSAVPEEGNLFNLSSLVIVNNSRLILLRYLKINSLLKKTILLHIILPGFRQQDAFTPPKCVNFKQRPCKRLTSAACSQEFFLRGQTQHRVCWPILGHGVRDQT